MFQFLKKGAHGTLFIFQDYELFDNEALFAIVKLRG
jgi:hypothetical protein